MSLSRRRFLKGLGAAGAALMVPGGLKAAGAVTPKPLPTFQPRVVPRPVVAAPQSVDQILKAVYEKRIRELLDEETVLFSRMKRADMRQRARHLAGRRYIEPWRT